jgi:hypothetical protein
MNTPFLRKKTKVENGAKAVQNEKDIMQKEKDENGICCTPREARLLKLLETFVDDMLETCGTVKVGFTSQTPVQVL